MELRYKISAFFGLLVDSFITGGALFAIAAWYLGGNELGALGGLIFFLIGTNNGMLVIWLLLVKCEHERKCNRELES